MFSKKDSDNVKEEVRPNSHNQIAMGTTIVGEIKSDTDIRLDGQLKGNLTTRGKLIIGDKGQHVGDITAKNAEIKGSIEGNIIIEELLILRATAKINGKISTNKLTIEPGATFSGSCDMSGGSGSTSSMQRNAKQTERQATK